ncbi:MAG: MoxR family ATPase [Pseudomonadota bacterium]
MFTSFLKSANTVIIGKEQQIKLVLCCLLSKGHLLIEDLPGMGKTTLAHLIARLFGLDFSRIQFTSDMLPADIIGINIFDKNSNQFQFQHGPIFSQLVLADEINRTTAKTQSALLEAMEENQVSVDGTTYPLKHPFFVIATQNPQSQAGTFSLPESQLDRFLMRIHLGYPDSDTERQILSGENKRDVLERIQAIFSIEQLIQMQQQVEQVFMSEPILDYIQSILSFSRSHKLFNIGLSPRAGLALVSASKAWAFIHQRKMIIPDDVNAVMASIIVHRISLHEQQSMLPQQILAEFEHLSVL